MTHPLVLQLRFTRSEFVRGLKEVTPEEAVRRFIPINSLSWMIGHVAHLEQAYWLTRAQGVTPLPELRDLVGFGKPATTPPLEDMWAAWRQITAASDPYLDTLTNDHMTTHLVINEKPHPESIGTMLMRDIYHYWYHLGEAQAVRQLLGHTNLPVFVGALGTDAPYTPE
ncbi:MAG: DinB family protein [Chloroflexi bacterium]|nr:DinB family protein [Chloroflexota bacterium]